MSCPNKTRILAFVSNSLKIGDRILLSLIDCPTYHGKKTSKILNKSTKKIYITDVPVLRCDAMRNTRIYTYYLFPTRIALL